MRMLRLRLYTNAQLELARLHTVHDLAQKAKVKWALEGDENTSFFHGLLNKKRRLLAIQGILKNRVSIESPAVVKAEFLEHYRNWFQQPTCTRPTLDSDMFNSLSPRCDGFTFKIFTSFWDLIVDDVERFVQEFFCSNIFPKGCNSFFISLIPKVPNVKSVFDFRPISLIGCQYKIIGKQLANRLSTVIGNCISPVQSAFLKGRYILDVPLILNDVLAWYRQHKKKLMVFKVDFEKAFDSLRWDFLDLILEKFGFGSKLRAWIRWCLHNGHSFVLINRFPMDEFKLFRGLRQGDPMSPFLFILAMEGLHALTRKAEVLGLFKGASIGRDNMCISYLMYADDVIFYGEWSWVNAHNLISMLRCFYLISGLKINIQKSNVLGIGVTDDEVSYLANIIRCGASQFPMKYLGVLVGCSMTRCTNWKVVVKKFSAKLPSWKAHLLSVSGWLSLIKLVLGNLSTYYMSIYTMPVSIHKQLESMRNKFFIGGDVGDKRMTWVKWDKCLMSKKDGGLGIGSIYGFNIALLFKWIWRFLNVRSDLSVHVIKCIHGVFLGVVQKLINSETFLLSSEASSFLTNGTLGSRLNIPIKVNVFLWRAMLNKLPSRVNLDRRGIDVDSILSPICLGDLETVNHSFFNCVLAKDLWHLLAKWWEMDIPVCGNFADWFDWLDSLHVPIKVRLVLEGVGGTLMWSIWNFCNSLIFSSCPPKKEVLWDSIVSQSFLWISSRNPSRKFSWIDEFRSHFSKRFQAPGASRSRLNFQFPNRLNTEQAAKMEGSILHDKIRNAVWSCGDNKSPGPDGFTFEFFRKFWNVIGPDFCAAVDWFFLYSAFAKGCNSSFIALIPKTPDAKFVGEFRPISLIGSLYKVITKILANRLSNVISDLVADVQTAFLPNRQILDGPFIVNEVLSWCKFKQKQAMVFKVDFAKAYDSVRWDFLDDVLEAFGFGFKWRSWVLGSLSSGMASIVINGSPTAEFKFHCGLKQGDPLAPYLFILIMESLHLSFSRVIDAGLFKGIKIDHNTQISHLFYADDAIFIGEWSDNNIKFILHVLHCFSLASGLKINLKKSNLLGFGVSREMVNDAASSLGCAVMRAPFKYLGVMVGGNMSMVKTWDEVISKLKTRLSKWKCKALSIGGRLTLLKSVLGSTPIYNLSLYKAPKTVLNTMESIRRNFFYGSNGLDTKITWVKWSKILAAKKCGGLGVSSYFALNRALLFKWVWRFISFEKSCWSRVIHAIHGPYFTQNPPRFGSVWGTIVREIQSLNSQGIDLLSFCRIRVGNGLQTRFWKDQRAKTAHMCVFLTPQETVTHVNLVDAVRPCCMH
ncbi:RNA-directed DNA polymerase, eukaryota [Tanacetum coccineum]